MTRSLRRMLGCVVVVFATAAGVLAQPPADVQPDQETLKRLAQQLGAGQPGQFDPKMIEWAQEFLKNNPQILNDPAFQQKFQEMKQQAAQNPNFAEQLKSQVTPQQLEQFKKYFPNTGNTPGGNPGFQPGGPMPPWSRPDLPPHLRPDQSGNPAANAAKQPFDNVPGNTKIPTRSQIEQSQMNQQAGMPRPNPGANPLDPAAAKNLAENNKEFSQLVNMWEANVGPLDNTPALKQSLVEMFSGTGKSPLDGMGSNNGNNPFSGMNGNGQGGAGKSIFDMNGSGNNGNGGFGNWLKNMTSNGGPSWWKNMTGSGSGKSWLSGATNGPSNLSPPSTNGFGGGGGFSGGIGAGGVTGLGTVGTILLFVILAAVVGFIVYRYWPQIQALRTKPKAIPGLGEWPIDPRDVRDRETLVRAFEYFSVFLCGDGARVWNHVTIAEAFRENVPASIPFADQLARLYAVARYTPAREEIAPADLAAARRHLCQLAGVSEA